MVTTFELAPQFRKSKALWKVVYPLLWSLLKLIIILRNHPKLRLPFTYLICPTWSFSLSLFTFVGITGCNAILFPPSTAYVGRTENKLFVTYQGKFISRCKSKDIITWNILKSRNTNGLYMLVLTVETSFLCVFLIACVRVCGWLTIGIQNVEIGSIWIYAKFIEERLEIG